MIKQFFSMAAVSVCTLAAEPAVSLFNGRDLDGWDGDPALWKVEDGVIVGETDDERKIQANTFLVWEGGEDGGEVADFDLRFKARLKTANNSGVQYRSERFGENGWRMKGYQFDLHPKQSYLGMIYEEGGRGIVCQRGQRVKLAEGRKPEEIGELEVEPTELGEWQDYRIVARGHELKHYVNGRLALHVIDADETKRSLSGLIGLQLHRGPAMRVEFKDIELRPVAEDS